MTDITIRSASLDDMDTLLEIEQRIIETERPFDDELKTESISYYDLEALILSAKAEVFVAEFENRIVGSGCALRNRISGIKEHQY